MTKSEWREQYSEVRRIINKFPDSAYSMRTFRCADQSVKEAIWGWGQIYMSYVWLKPQKLTRVLIHQRLNYRLVK